MTRSESSPGTSRCARAELLGGGFTSLTVLRDPSNGRCRISVTTKSSPGGPDKSLEAIYDDEFRFQTLVHNHMVKMFSLTTS